MSRGHGIIVNLSNYLPYVFIYNPTELDYQKPIKYFTVPNIGGAFHEKFFTGFENSEVTVNLTCINMEAIDGVKSDIAYFKQFREPAPGLLGIAGSFFGNENYPPPQMLFQFGISEIPLVWDPISVSIKESLFHDGTVRGIIGVPKRADITLTLSLDENSILYKSQQIAEKAKQIAGSILSIKKELNHKSKGTRKEMPGIFNPDSLRGK